MSNYTQATFFAPKDALLTGNPLKLIKGADFDPEFAAIAVAIATKLDSSNASNPTGTIGLTAVNGSATTYMRSDASQPLSQAIVPTWTGLHTFNVGGTNFVDPTLLLNGGTFGTQLQFGFPSGGTDGKTVQLNGSGNFTITFVNDAGTVFRNGLLINRSGQAVSQVVLGNSTDKAPITLNGAAIIQNVGSAIGLTITPNGSNGSIACLGTTSNAAIIEMQGNGNAEGTSSGGFIGVPGANNQIATGSIVGALVVRGTNIYFSGNGGAGISMAIDSANHPFFTGATTTASAANAFLDGSNQLLKSTSSARYKTNVRTLGEDLAAHVLDLRPVVYNSLASEDDPSADWYGLIAEEVHAIDPRLVHYDTKGRPDGVQYDRLAVLLLSVVKRLVATAHG